MKARTVDVTALPPETLDASLRHLAETLRPADLDEIAAATGGEPLGVLRESVRVSRLAWLILDRTGLPIGVFGVSPALVPGMGVIWLLGSAGFEHEAVAIARQTPDFLARMHAEFPILFNHVDARNEFAIRWLLRLGFHLIDADSAYGVEARLFFEFARLP